MTTIRIVFLLTFLLALGSAEGALAQPEPSGASPAQAPAVAAPETEIQSKRAELAKELTELAQQFEAAAASQHTEAVEQLTTQRELLEKIDFLYGQRLAAVRHANDLAASLQELQEKLTAHRASGFTQPPPYSLTQLDQLYDELDAQTVRQKTIDAARQEAADALQQAQELFEKREQARRQAREAFEKNTDPAATSGLQLRLRTSQLESRAAAAQVALREVELKNEKQSAALQTQRETLLREQIAWIEERLAVASQDLEEALAQVEKKEADLRIALEKAERELSTAERRWSTAQQRLDATPEPEPGLIEEVEARRLARQLSQQAVSLLSKQLERLATARTVWKRRHLNLSSQVTRKELPTWKQESAQAVAELDRSRRLGNTRLEELRRDLTALQAKLATASAGNAPTVSQLREQEQTLQRLISIHEADLTSVDTARRLHQRLLTEIQRQAETVTLAERAQLIMESAFAVWRYELLVIDDQPIMVRTVVTAILLLVLGILLSRYLSRLLGLRLLPRFGLDSGAATAFQTLAFYFLVTFFTLFALRTLNVPLTLFTFFGGALAIGVGFGSQNIINNFISGLILLTERPIRVGDMVDVEGTYGSVERVGLRSTRVRSFTNIHIIVPNSAFLEKNVINWTLSDDLVRVNVSVGVVYGSPTREVARLIQQAIEEHEKILKVPEPIVLFTEFGDNSLNFEAHFWIRMKRLMDRRRVESDLRYRIDDLFRAADIVIAFPQRDVHLDTVKPLDVRLLSGHVEHRDATADTTISMNQTRRNE
ncbi:MAG: mechanosensitive ion channel domain-containing protein [Candidatus Binatia bacterium]